MAKKAASKVNLSEAIRQALTANPEKMPKEIAAVLREQGVRVTPAYVSTVKFSLGGTKRATRRVARRMGRRAGVSHNPLMAAVEFIRAAGGLEQAKAALTSIEEIRRM